MTDDRATGMLVARFHAFLDALTGRAPPLGADDVARLRSDIGDRYGTAPEDGPDRLGFARNTF